MTARPGRRPRQQSAQRAAAAVLAALLTLAGCTSQGSEGSVPGARATTSPTATTPSDAAPPRAGTATQEPASTALPRDVARPAGGACYDLGFVEATEPTNLDPPVSCGGARHTTQTIHVGHLDTVVDGHLLAVDSDLAQERVADACERRFVRHVGGTAEARRLSRLQVVWFSPTLSQSDQGASWFRCDLVLLAAPQELAPLPPPRRLRGVLDRPDALDDLGLCGTAAPGTPRFTRVVCSSPHTWRALASIPIEAGRAYPGEARARQAGEAECRDRARVAQEAADEFRYGWEWPTREQWSTGRRHGYCWVPD